jgi:hypothetical protein
MSEIPVNPAETPKKNNTPIIIAVVVIVLLCCCCLIGIPLVNYLWENGDAIFGTSTNLLTNFS